MANRVYFVTEAFVKQNTPISLNVEPQLINLAIFDAQVLHVQMVLGSRLYKKLETLVAAGTMSQPANAAYKTLMDDYVQPAVLQWTLAECLPYVRFKIMNKGVQGQSSDNSEPITLEELKYLQAQLKDKAEFHTQRVADFLCANSADYPEYVPVNSDDIAPNKNAYFCGIYLGESKRASERFLGLNENTIDSNI